MRRFFQPTVMIAIFLLFGGFAFSGLLVPMSVQEMTQRSDLVLHGTVVSKECRRDPSGRIFTRIELQLQDVWKGTVASSPFVIVHSGGSIGGQQLTASDQVDFKVGEEVAVFLVLNQRGEGVSLGLAQGKFRVWTDPPTGDRFAFNRFHGRAPSAPAGGSSRASISSQPALLPLRDLKRQVQGAAQ